LLDWEILYKKFGRNLSAQKFEALALDYVESIYPEYDWIPTNKTWDGNKDFQLANFDIFDMWGEAKYKKKSSSLSKKDIDPTILSGLIQGNVKLIIFVSNGKIPKSILERTLIGARIKKIEISYVLAHQLESWLFLNPDRFRKYFEIDPIIISTEPVVEIKSITIYDIYSTDFNPLVAQNKLFYEDEYVLCVIIYSSVNCKGEVVSHNEVPFLFISHPNYDTPDDFELKSGISILTFLIKTRMEYSNPVSLSIKINNDFFHYVINNVTIMINQKFNMTYSQQLEITSQIIDAMNRQSTGEYNYLITLYAESGLGKSHLLKYIYENYALIRDMTIVNFESAKNNNINYLLLCKIILFFLYGNLFWIKKGKGKNEINAIKELLIGNNRNGLFDNEFLVRLIDGCFDSSVAHDTIVHLYENVKKMGNINMQSYDGRSNKILLIDDFHYLDSIQQKVFLLILSQLVICKNNTLIVLSATKGKFVAITQENSFLELTPNHFVLLGLSHSDKKISIANSLGISPNDVSNAIIRTMPSNLLFACEIMHILKKEYRKHNSDLSFVKKYIENLNKINVMTNKFNGSEKQYYLLDLIYKFKRGIQRKYIYMSKLYDKQVLNKDIQMLIQMCVIKSDRGILYPYHDYLISSYFRLRKEKHYNDNLGRIIAFMIETKPADIDHNHLLAILARCGRKYYQLYKTKIRELIMKYVRETRFGAALQYCEIIYELLNRKQFANCSKDELHLLYLYAYCLDHCNKGYSSIEILNLICNITERETLEWLEASVTRLNIRFWSADITVIDDSYALEYSIMCMLKTNIDSNEKNRLLEIYSTTINRRMVTQLLSEDFISADKTFKRRLKEIVQSYGKEFRSHAATLIMDYARGISILSPQKARKLMRIAKKYYSYNCESHYRRIIICNIDLCVYDSIIDNQFDLSYMRELSRQLLLSSFYSGYFKSILKIIACRLIGLSSHIGSQRDKISDNVIRDTIDEIYECLIEIEFQPADRTSFLLNSILAYLEITKGNYDLAFDILIETHSYTKKAGAIYSKIVQHNLDNIRNVKKICWYSSELDFLNDNVYLLDTRFW